MAILTPSQLTSASNATYFDNTSGSITPTAVRTLNTDWISSSILTSQTSSMSVATASFTISASFATDATNAVNATNATNAVNATNATNATYAGTAGTAGTAVTASFVGNAVITASANVSTITFTRADNTTFDVTVSQSGSVATASFAIFATTAATASYANQFNVALGLTASGLRYPIADGLEYQSLQTNGAGVLAFDYTKTLYKKIKNGEATSIVKGTPLYVSGSQGDLSIVYVADANNPNRMPATVIAYDNSLAAGAEGTAVILGLIEGVDTSAYTPGTEVYVGVGGGWTSTRPTGSAEVQPLGVVTRQAVNGAGIVLTVPPTILPNIQQGYTWVGNASGVPVATATSSLSVLSSSYANYANLLDGFDFSSFVFTSSFNTFSGSVSSRLTNAASLTADNTFSGNNVFTRLTSSFAQFTSASIQYLSVIYQTSSVVYSSGSNVFGDAASDTQTLWGTVDIVTGPVNVTGSVRASGGFTGSLVGTASWSSNAVVATTALNANNATSASFATTANLALLANQATTAATASYVLNAVSASFATNATTSATASSVSTLNQAVTIVGTGTRLTITGSAAGAAATLSDRSMNVIAYNSQGVDVFSQLYSSDTGTAGQYIGAIKSDFSVDVEHAIIATTNSITLNDWDNNSAVYIPYMTIAPNVGDNPAPQMQRGLGVTGSLYGNVVSSSVASNTSSLDFSTANFFTSLVTSNTFFNITNPKPGETVNLLLTTNGVATASFSSNVKQPSGSRYTPTSGSGKVDVLSFISFDGTSTYLANIKNMI